jgi:hypothetical protein
MRNFILQWGSCLFIPTELFPHLGHFFTRLLQWRVCSFIPTEHFPHFGHRIRASLRDLGSMAW